MTNPDLEGGPTCRVTLDGTDDSFIVRPPETILTAARRQGYWLPYECGWGSCSRCKASLVEGDIEVLFPQAPAMSERDSRRNRYLLCQSTAASDITIKPMSITAEPTVERPTQDFTATLTSRVELGPSIVELVFTLDQPATYRAGQYAILHMDERLHRCYSMSNAPHADQVEFIIKRYPGHPGSTHMYNLSVGDHLTLELPYGDMYMRENDCPVMMIAGGTGISAVLAMLREIAADPSWPSRPLHVLYGAGSLEELVCWDELLTLADSGVCRVHGALVQAPDDWQGHTGFVTQALTEVLASELGQEQELLSAEVYLAGPPVMVDAVKDCLHQHGFQWDRVHVDSFG